VAPTEGVVSHLADSAGIHPGVRGLIVAGAGCGSPAAVLTLSRALRWPVLADPRSGVRLDEPGVIGAADGILRSGRFASAHVPECIIRLGERWASKVVNGFVSVAGAGGTIVVVDPYGRWSDPERTTTTFVRSDPTSFCLDLAGHLLDRHPPHADAPGEGCAAPPGEADWWRGWSRAEARAWTAITAELSGGPERAGGGGPLTEPALAHRLFSRVPSEATLVVSSSMPVRDVEAFAAPRSRPPRALSNRGASGIDGVVSTALGVAIGAPGPVVALVGDLAFLHDVSALVGSEGSDLPLTVVVADNGGGGIFSFLEQASALDPTTFEELFGTPQGPDVAAVAAGFGWPVDDVDGGDHPVGFEEALDRRLAGDGSSVIRVRLPGRSENVAVHGRLHAAIVEAVDAVHEADSAQQGLGS
jgi:2-succinyl-5-enolpyruvyl-6-hydroxy-3-cyclohexene-1-carboxylate synthase